MRGIAASGMEPGLGPGEGVASVRVRRRRKDSRRRSKRLDASMIRSLRVSLRSFLPCPRETQQSLPLPLSSPLPRIRA